MPATPAEMADAGASAEAREPAAPPCPAPEAVETGDPPETVVTADAGARLLQTVRDLWRYRDLFWAFVLRDVKVRYKQTFLGVVWIVLQPLVAGGLFGFIFMRLGFMAEAGAVEAVLFFVAGLAPWTSFASAVQNASLSMETHAHLITKVYFPRMAIPAAYVLGATLDYAISFAVLLALAAAAGKLGWGLVLAGPLLLTLQMGFALGVGLFFGALNAQYRDVKYAIPFLLQVGMLLTVLLPLDQWPGPVSSLLAYNPMGAVVETYRALLNAEAVPGTLLLKGTLVALVGLLGGAWFFARREARMADIL